LKERRRRERNEINTWRKVRNFDCNYPFLGNEMNKKNMIYDSLEPR